MMTGPVLSVIYISRKYPPAIGGMERFSADLIETSLAGEKDLLVMRGSQWNLLWWIPYSILSTLWRLNRRRPRVIHLTDAMLAPFFLPLAISYRVPVVVTAHGLDITWRFPFYRLLLKRTLPRASAVVAVSQKTAECCRSLGVSDERLRVIPNGIRAIAPVNRVAARQELLARLGKSNFPGLVLLGVGRLVRRKNFQWFVEAVFSRLQADALFILIGDGPERAAIEQAVRHLILSDRVICWGNAPDSQRDLAYAGADLLVMPNREIPSDVEGFGLVSLEAGGYGLPVVANAVDGIVDGVVEGRNGRLIRPGDTKEFINALDEFARNRESLETLSHSARDFVMSNFRWEDIAKQYMELYQQIS